MLVSHLRAEEKLILAAARARGVETLVLTDRALALDLTDPAPPAVDVVLDRCVAHTRGGYALRVFDAWGIPTLNSSAAVATCDDKVVMSLALARAGVPQLRTAVAFSVAGALAIGERFGYPLVVKPVTGSWGRLLARASDPAALRTLLEQKVALGGPQHGVFYIQEYMRKPGRDIRAFLLGGQVVAASYRAAEHWITNVARGAVSTRCAVTDEIQLLAGAAAQAVGAELAGVGSGRDAGRAESDRDQHRRGVQGPARHDRRAHRGLDRGTRVDEGGAWRRSCRGVWLYARARRRTVGRFVCRIGPQLFLAARRRRRAYSSTPLRIGAARGAH